MQALGYRSDPFQLLLFQQGIKLFLLFFYFVKSLISIGIVNLSLNFFDNFWIHKRQVLKLFQVSLLVDLGSGQDGGKLGLDLLNTELQSLLLQSSFPLQVVGSFGLNFLLFGPCLLLRRLVNQTFVINI